MRQKLLNLPKKGYSPSRNDKKFYIMPGECSFYDNNGTLSHYQEYIKSATYVSNLPVSILYQTTLIVPKEVPIEDIPSIYEEEALNDLALDTNTEYIMRVKKSDSDLGGSVEYDTLLAPVPKIGTLFESCNIKHIDYLIPTPYVLESLFELGYIEKSAIKVIFFIDANEIFGALYRDGKLSFFRGLDKNIDDLVAYFNESSPEKIDKTKLLELLKEPKPEFENALKRVYGVIFSECDNFLIYAKRTQRIGDFETIYIDSERGISAEFYSYINENYGYEFRAFEFRDSLEGEIIPYASLRYIEAMHGQIWQNFTIFEKPQPLLKRSSVKMVLALVASLLLTLAYPIYNYTLSYIVNKESRSLKEKNRAYEIEKQKLDRELESLRRELSSVQEELKRINGERDSYLTELENFLTYQKKYNQKSKTILDISDFLKENDVRLSSIDFKESNDSVFFTLDVVSNDRDSIASLINTLIKKGKFYITVNSIEKNGTVYRSSLKAELR